MLDPILDWMQYWLRCKRFANKLLWSLVAGVTFEKQFVNKWRMDGAKSQNGNPMTQTPGCAMQDGRDFGNPNASPQTHVWMDGGARARAPIHPNMGLG